MPPSWFTPARADAPPAALKKFVAAITGSAPAARVTTFAAAVRGDTRLPLGRRRRFLEAVFDGSPPPAPDDGLRDAVRAALTAGGPPDKVLDRVAAALDEANEGRMAGGDGDTDELASVLAGVLADEETDDAERVERVRRLVGGTGSAAAVKRFAESIRDTSPGPGDPARIGLARPPAGRRLAEQAGGTHPVGRPGRRLTEGWTSFI